MGLRSGYEGDLYVAQGNPSISFIHTNEYFYVCELSAAILLKNSSETGKKRQRISNKFLDKEIFQTFVFFLFWFWILLD